ncbi:MAG TPA: DUF4405 domain-containing protein [Rhodanobacter sp.]|nr:DUF4405 domain-containing protein [Rhodanobacter sp.]
MSLNQFMHRYGTPLTAGLFAVSAVSGIALFFHWSSRSFHAMHEWLSMLLLAPFVLHLWKNWKPLLGYARRKTLIIPLVLSVAVAVPFAMTAGKGGRSGNPAFQTVALMTQSSLVDLAPVFRSTPEALLRHLQQRGYQATSIDQSPSAIATASAVNANEVLFSLMPTQPAAKVDKG